MDLAVDGANRHDMTLVLETVNNMGVWHAEPALKHPQCPCLDKGYDFSEVRHTVAELGFTAHIRSRGEETELSKGRLGSQPGVGEGTDSRLAEPLPAHPGLLEPVLGELQHLPAFRLSHHRTPCRWV